MHNQILVKLYFSSPKRFREKILKYITRREGGQMYSRTLREIFRQQFNIEIGYGSYGGCFASKNIPSGTVFGNYCSVAQNIRIFRANHPKETFTSHPLLYNPVAGYVTNDLLERPKLIIGHDVWIGEWTIILPKVLRIGNGAIIGAGSVVTKNVDPYSIVAGNPAKLIGKRFEPNIIKKLEESEWWLMNRQDLIKSVPNLIDLVRLR